jgi:hypothetical protein
LPQSVGPGGAKAAAERDRLALLAVVLAEDARRRDMVGVIVGGLMGALHERGLRDVVPLAPRLAKPRVAAYRAVRACPRARRRRWPGASCHKYPHFVFVFVRGISRLGDAGPR